MSVETGAGSPVGYTTGEAGEGAPVLPSAIAGAESGSGSPVVRTVDSEWLIVRMREPYATAAQAATYPFDPAYSEDGGELAEVESAWPTLGPFTVQLRTPAGTLLPTGGCYSGVPGQGSEIYANASKTFLRFAMPKCPRGTYDLVITWDGGGTELANAVRVVPAMVPEYTRKVLTYAGVGAFMEKR